MYKLKQIPEDFIVEEVFDYNPEERKEEERERKEKGERKEERKEEERERKEKGERKEERKEEREEKGERKEEGEYIYVKIKKKNISTPEIIDIISSKLKVPSKNIGVAGNKDKKAITTQLISIRGVSEDNINKLNLKDIEINVLGRSNEPISLGSHECNKFIITVRDLKENEYKTVLSKLENKTKIKFINYFGEQRFGKNNVNIGLSIMKGDFKKACELIDSHKLNEYLNQNSNDYIGALKKVQKRVLTLYIHSVQSHIWNILAENFKQEVLSVPGYMTEYLDMGMMKCVEEYLSKYQLTQRDFIIRPIPNLFTGGDNREREVHALDVNIIERGKDELNSKDGDEESKYKIILSFTLPKGSYATVFVKSLFD